MVAARTIIFEELMIQCVLSSTFQLDCRVKPLIITALCAVTNPSNYLYFYDFVEYQIHHRCQSRKSLRQLSDRVQTTNPIAGNTRPRGIDEEAGSAMGSLDLACGIQKKPAEHRMLRILGRNDIGRIAAQMG